MCQFTVLKNRKTKKSGPSGGLGPANASSWHAKRGDTSEIVNIFQKVVDKLFGQVVAVEGGTLWRKNKFSKKNLTMPKNKKRGPFGVVQHPFCRKTAKNEGDPLGKKFSEKN